MTILMNIAYIIRALFRTGLARKNALHFVPWKDWRYKKTGQFALPLIFWEDGTIEIGCYNDPNIKVKDMGWAVVRPDDLELIEK